MHERAGASITTSLYSSPVRTTLVHFSIILILIDLLFTYGAIVQQSRYLNFLTDVSVLRFFC